MCLSKKTKLPSVNLCSSAVKLLNVCRLLFCLFAVPMRSFIMEMKMKWHFPEMTHVQAKKKEKNLKQDKGHPAYGQRWSSTLLTSAAELRRRCELKGQTALIIFAPKNMLVKISTNHPQPELQWTSIITAYKLQSAFSTKALIFLTYQPCFYKNQGSKCLYLVLFLCVVVVVVVVVVVGVVVMITWFSLCCSCPWPALSMSVYSLLYIIFLLVPITSLTNKLDWPSVKSLCQVNTPLSPCERQRECLQKEYMSIDRPSWPRLGSTIARYWCAGIALEGRRIDIMVWCGPLRAGLPVLKPDWLTLGQCSHLHRPSLVFVLRPLGCRTRKSSERGCGLSLNRPTNMKWTPLTLTVDFLL